MVRRKKLSALQVAKGKIAFLEAQLLASERAVSIFSRDADVARREADEHRRRRLDLEEEVKFMSGNLRGEARRNLRHKQEMAKRGTKVVRKLSV